MQMTRAWALLGFLAVSAAAGGSIAGCAGSRGRAGQPNWREQGLASWYGADFNGRRTANGERYNMYAMTAAHKTLPLGTQIVVINRQTGKRIRVRVNDRGPFVAGRIVDLSLAAARALGSAAAGVVPVTLEAVLPDSAFVIPSAASSPQHPGSPPPLRGAFAVQVGAFVVENNARALAARLPVPPGAAKVLRFEDNRGTWWRVRATGYESELEADAAAGAFDELGLPGFIVRED
jgi:rare lipoprotein A